MSFRLAPKSVTLSDLEQRVYLPGVLRKSSRSLSHLLMSSCMQTRSTGTRHTSATTRLTSVAIRIRIPDSDRHRNL